MDKVYILYGYKGFGESWGAKHLLDIFRLKENAEIKKEEYIESGYYSYYEIEEEYFAD